MLIIFWASGRPVLIQDPNFYAANLDKVLHFGAWFILGICLRLSLHGYFGHHSTRFLVGILLGVGFGLFDEVYQSFVPSRVGDVTDLVADALGTLTGVFIGDRFIANNEL